MLFKGFPNECDVLSSLRNGALETRSSAAWATEWEEHAKPLVLEASTASLSISYFWCVLKSWEIEKVLKLYSIYKFI